MGDHFHGENHRQVNTNTSSLRFCFRGHGQKPLQISFPTLFAITLLGGDSISQLLRTFNIIYSHWGYGDEEPPQLKYWLQKWLSEMVGFRRNGQRSKLFQELGSILQMPYYFSATVNRNH